MSFPGRIASIYTSLIRQSKIWSEEVVEKTINVKARASLQPLFETREINFKYLKSYNPLVKKDKNKAN